MYTMSEPELNERIHSFLDRKFDEFPKLRENRLAQTQRLRAVRLHRTLQPAQAAQSQLMRIEG